MELIIKQGNLFQMAMVKTKGSPCFSALTVLLGKQSELSKTPTQRERKRNRELFKSRNHKLN